MKTVLKKSIYLIVIVSIFMQLIIPVSFAVEDGNIISKTVKEADESYNKADGMAETIANAGTIPYISFNGGDYQIFSMTIPEDGCYNLNLLLGCASTSYKPITTIYIFSGNEYVETAQSEISPTGGYKIFSEQNIGIVELKAGTYKFKILQMYADIHLSAFSLNKSNIISKTVKEVDESYNKATEKPDAIVTTQNIPYISFNGGDYQIFSFDVSEAGVYRFDIKVGAQDPTYQPITSVYLYDGTDYVSGDSIIIKPTGGYTEFKQYTVGFYELSEGTHKIKVMQNYADVFFSSLTLTKVSNGNIKQTIDVSDYDTSTVEVSDDGMLIFSQADWAAYNVNIPVSGVYRLFVTGGNTFTNCVLSAFVDDKEVCLEQLEKGNNNLHSTYTIGDINLLEGETIIKLKHTGLLYTNFKISSVTLVKVGYLKRNAILPVTSLTVNDAINVSGDDNEFETEDMISFDVEFTDETIYKVSIKDNRESVIGVSIDGKTVGVLNTQNNECLFFQSKKGKSNLNLRIISGTALFEEILLESYNITDDELNQFVTDVNNADTVIDMEKVIDKWKESVLPEFDSDMSFLLSETPVYAALCAKSYDNAGEIVSNYNNIAAKEKQLPSICLYNGTNQIESLESGELYVKIKTDFVAENTTVAACVYENNRLIAIGKYFYSAEESDISVSLGNLNLSTDKEYKFKLFYFSDFEKVIPSDNLNVIYKEFYVSEKGLDTNSGTIDLPFLTVERALIEVKNYTDNMNGDIIINVLDGNYSISEPIELTTDHSGKNGYDVIIRGVGSLKPTINGGEKIENWSLYENGIYRAKYNKGEDVRNLYINNFPAIRAKSEYAFRCEELYTSDGETYTGVIVDDSNFPKTFNRPQDLELVWELVWEAQRTPVTNISYDGDMANISINENLFSRNNPNFNTGFGTDKQFYLENAYELIDTPGEFYYNIEDGYIYYYPVDGEDLNSSEIYVAKSQGLVNISGDDTENKVENIKFENIKFKYGAWNYVSDNGFIGRQADSVSELNGSGYFIIPAQFTVNYADNISVRDCEFSCLGSSALAYRNAVSNSEIVGNKIIDVSGTGIAVGSFEHEYDLPLSCENIQVKNNLIRRAAIEYRGCTGISFYYDTGIEISHNTLLDLPYTAITGGWGWGATITGRAGNNRICYNYIDNVMNALSDGGGIYFLGHQRNTIISHNYINRVNRRNASLYSDNGSVYLYFTKNVCVNSERFATASPGAHTNYFIDNYTDTDFIYEEYDGEPEDFFVKADNKIIDPENLPQEAVSIKDNAGIQSDYFGLFDNTLIPEGKKSIIDITPKRTYTNGGTVYEAEEYYTSLSDIGAGVIVYKNCLGISYPQWAEFIIEIDEAGVYDMGIYASVGNATGPTISVLVNGEEQTEALIQSTGSWSIYTNNDVGEIILPKGEVTLRINCLKNSFQIDCFTLKYLREN